MVFKGCMSRLMKQLMCCHVLLGAGNFRVCTRVPIAAIRPGGITENYDGESLPHDFFPGLIYRLTYQLSDCKHYTES